MLARLLGTGLTLICLAVVYGALERAFPARSARRWRDADVLADGCFFLGQYLVWSMLAISLLSSFHGLLDAHAWRSLRETAAALPLWLLALIAVVLGDVLVYWLHRACHRFDFLWRFHAVHHSSERLDWLAAHREHPIDGMLTQLAQNLPAMLVGLPFEALAVLIAFRGAWAILIHSNVRLPLGSLRLLCGAPELHHFHHARVERTAHNFANLAPWLDVVFGTYHRPPSQECYELGLTQPWPKGYLAQLLRPFWPERKSVTPLVENHAAPVVASEHEPAHRRRHVLPSAHGVRTHVGAIAHGCGCSSGPARVAPGQRASLCPEVFSSLESPSPYAGACGKSE